MKKIGNLYVVSPEPLGNVPARIIEAARCGADIVQIRSKKLYKDDLIALVRYVKTKIPEYVMLIVNDYPEVEIMSVADGIHGGKGDFGFEDIRIFKEKYNLIVGVSVYDSLKRGELAEKYGADYVAFSSPFPSPSKEKVFTSKDVIEKAVSTLNLPVFVIGGINDSNIEEILELGVHGVAVLSYAFMGDTCERVKKLKSLIEKYAR